MSKKATFRPFDRGAALHFVHKAQSKTARRSPFKEKGDCRSRGSTTPGPSRVAMIWCRVVGGSPCGGRICVRDGPQRECLLKASRLWQFVGLISCRDGQFWWLDKDTQKVYKRQYLPSTLRYDFLLSTPSLLLLPNIFITHKSLLIRSILPTFLDLLSVRKCLLRVLVCFTFDLI